MVEITMVENAVRVRCECLNAGVIRARWLKMSGSDRRWKGDEVAFVYVSNVCLVKNLNNIAK